MAKLYNWYLTKEKYGNKDYVQAHGIVTSHVSLDDSDFIHTSVVESVNVSEEGSVVILTRNTEYHCLMADAKYSAFIDSTLIPNFDIFKEKYSNSESKEYKTDENSVLLVLGNNKEYYFDMMIANKDGVYSFLIEPNVHVGTFQDSVIIRSDNDVPSYNINLAYFPYKGRCIEFYSWQDEFKVFIENIGDADLKIKVQGYTYKIKPNERKEITTENAESKDEEIVFSTVDLHDVWGGK